MNTTQPDTIPREGDYYGVIYKGGFIFPMVVLGIALAITIWLIRRRKRR